MIEVYPNLYVGSEDDERRIRGQAGWFVVHACKEPYHRHALGYRTPGAPKNHPEYLIARRDRRLILNLVDAPDARYIPVEIIDAAIAAIEANITAGNVLIHCNEGKSRSPGIAFLYLRKNTDLFRAMDIDAAIAQFRLIYPSFVPGVGIAGFIRGNAARYSPLDQAAP
jgi:predicted protein tyrosine phosphatase